MAITNKGVLAWCDSIRMTMANDPGRELFAAQVQQHGFDFLDNYIADVLARQPTDSVYDLMKTPGKKKDGAKRTRTATTAAAKLKAMDNTIFEEVEDEKENPMPVNDFQRALMDARDEKKADSLLEEMDSRPAVKKVIPKTVTVMDSPSTSIISIEEDQPMDTETLVPQDHSSSMPEEEHVSSSIMIPIVHEVDEPMEPATKQPVSPLVLTSPVAREPSPRMAVSEPNPLDSIEKDNEENEPPKELSIIAEDDEPGEQSSLRTVSTEQEQPVPTLSTTDDMDQDLTVPLRDSSTSGTLKRKQSMTQFSGLPAPSPLRKSMRMSREPSIGTGLLAPSLAHTPGTGLGGKRTSWLSKAKEAKALELTGPSRKHATFSEGTAPHLVGLGLGLPSGFRKASARPSSKDVFNITPSASSPFAAPATGENDTDMVVDHPQEQSRARRGKSPSSLDNDNTGRLDASKTPEQQLDSKAVRHMPSTVQALRQEAVSDSTVPLNEKEAETGALDRLKKRLEDAGARSFRSIGKSLGGNAAAALAEARAAAEARVAQRNKDTGEDVSVVEVETSAVSDTKDAVSKEPQSFASKEQSKQHSPLSSEAHKRLSLSELVSSGSRQKIEPHSPADAAQISSGNGEVDMSISTTPPNSPPSLAQGPSIPVFKPILQPSEPRISTAKSEPKPAPSTNPLPPFVFKLPGANPFTLPTQNSALNVQTAVPASSSSKPLSAESSKSNIFSDNIFDKPEGARGWMPTMQVTQDTDFSTNPIAPQQDQLDDEDSWHIDEKFRANETWTPYGFVNDKTQDTWSTLPSRSTGETESLPPPTHGFAEALRKAVAEPSENYVVHAEDDDPIPGAFDFDPKAGKAQFGITDEDLEDLQDVSMDLDDSEDEVDLENIVAAGKATINLVQKKPEPPRPQSQMSLNSVSTSSSQSNVGLLGQATRFMTSMLGTSKPKTKNEPVKSIIRAAAIAKKQQGEADKKANRLKEMENRRQQAMQRKAEEEKARAEEEEKRIKEENEKRKREREEHTGKLPIPKALKKADDDTMGKRKLAEAQKKVEAKKPLSKDAQSSRTMKPSSSTHALGSSSKLAGPSKPTLSKQASSSSLAASMSVKDIPVTKAASSLKTTAIKGKAKVVDKETAQPSEILQNQMAERAKAQVVAAQTPKQPPPIASEDIELPDINSEYSDSEDEDRPKTFNPPEWAQSPELRQQLEDQSRYNPDDIFGRIGPLRMEEIFRTRQSRFRARTSSANWAGTDELTEYEEREYARRMGYTNKP